MKNAKVLFISSEITPYLEESEISLIGRNLPQGIQEKGKEIRTFMPRFGLINERRNQLHEVIRLSGMNIIIDENDHPLIIKVASIQSARMQVYFIDNEEYFQRKSIFTDKEGKFFEDNDERAIFFCRGVLETVKKLGWAPDVIHCHGWMSSLVPMYVKKAYADDPIFADSKIVYSIYDDTFKGNLNGEYAKKVGLEGVTAEDTQHLDTASYLNITKTAIDFSDGVIFGSKEIDSEVEGYVRTSDKMILNYQDPETYINAYSEFYDEVLMGESVLAD